MNKFYVYIVKCEDNYLYAGIINSINRRFLQHQLGLSKITKNRGKIELVYYQSFDSRIDAVKREKEIKGWKRSKKDYLIKRVYIEKIINNFRNADVAQLVEQHFRKVKVGGLIPPIGSIFYQIECFSGIC